MTEMLKCYLMMMGWWGGWDLMGIELGCFLFLFLLWWVGFSPFVLLALIVLTDVGGQDWIIGGGGY